MDTGHEPQRGQTVMKVIPLYALKKICKKKFGKYNWDINEVIDAISEIEKEEVK